MKTVTISVFQIKLLTLLLLVLTAVKPTNAEANVLANPGFESGLSGWSGHSGTAVGLPVRTGLGALQLSGAGGFTVPVHYQDFAASPGDVAYLSGYMRTVDPLPQDITNGLLKIEFYNSDNVWLPPASVSIGIPSDPNFPGIDAQPTLTFNNESLNWLFAEAQGVAPADTVKVRFLAINVDESAADIFYDDLFATIVPVPEPSTYALLGSCLVLVASVRKRRLTALSR